MCASSGYDGGKLISLTQGRLEKNDQLAASNRALLARRHVAAFNLMSAPGSGKTTLLEALIHRLSDRVPMAVIEGDQETDRDAARIRAAGCPVVQINTRTGGHLDAQMVKVALVALNPPQHSLLLVENVGNLVCPALFDLGERAKMVVMSVTEGENTPLKYPHMFRAARVLVLTKIDLLPNLDFDIDACLTNAFRVNADLRVFAVSAKDGFGMANLCHWLTTAVNVPTERADQAQG
jgi:hydrogenase nickel incorporation protein HypB